MSGSLGCRLWQTAMLYRELVGNGIKHTYKFASLSLSPTNTVPFPNHEYLNLKRSFRIEAVILIFIL